MGERMTEAEAVDLANTLEEGAFYDWYANRFPVYLEVEQARRGRYDVTPETAKDHRLACAEAWQARRGLAPAPVEGEDRPFTPLSPVQVRNIADWPTENLRNDVPVILARQLLAAQQTIREYQAMNVELGTELDQRKAVEGEDQEPFECLLADMVCKLVKLHVPDEGKDIYWGHIWKGTAEAYRQLRDERASGAKAVEGEDLPPRPMAISDDVSSANQRAADELKTDYPLVYESVSRDNWADDDLCRAWGALVAERAKLRARATEVAELKDGMRIRMGTITELSDQLDVLENADCAGSRVEVPGEVAQRVFSAAGDVVDYWIDGGYMPGIEDRLVHAVQELRLTLTTKPEGEGM